MLPLKRIALMALSWRCLMNRIRLALMLYIFMVAKQSCMPNPTKGLLEVYEDMVEVLHVREMFLTKDS